MREDGERSPRDIQADIERTRSELDQTLSAIERRLTPGQLVDQGIDYLRHSGAREYLVNLGASAKQDPLPLALVAVGLGWLMLSGNRDRAGHGVATRPGASAEDLAEGARDATAGLRSAASSVRESVSGAVSSAGETVSSLRDGAARASRRISEATHAATDRAHRVGDAARHGADRLRSRLERFAHEQPMALGAIGIAAGAVLAASAPRTRPEDHLMGDASERLKERAKEAGMEQMDRAAEKLGANGDRPAADAELEAAGSSSDACAAPPSPPP
jgi:hypothetical protein